MLSLIATEISNPPPPKSTMILPVITTMNEMKRTKKKIGVGSVVKENVGEMEDKTR